MLARVVTGLVLAPVVVGLVLYAPKPATYILLALVAARCVDELLRMSPECRRSDRIVAALLGTALATSPLAGRDLFLLVAGLAPVLLLAWTLVGATDVQLVARRAALGLLGLGYPAVLTGMMVAVFARNEMPLAIDPPFGLFDAGRGALLGLFVMVFLGDTGAYFAGRAFGRHKLNALISPKKTREGAIGGLLASVLGGWLTAWALLPGIGLGQGLVLGGLCGAIGQVGDLVESLFKRATNTKDSGQLLPGHGGLLDRVDGVLFAAPVLLAFLELLHGPGGAG